MLGNNPAGVNCLVGAEENSPKAVHHRGASYTWDFQGQLKFNIFTLYGTLTGDPGSGDLYKDDRANYK